MSLVDPDLGDNLLADNEIRDIVKKGILDSYHRNLPLLRLPELIEGEDLYTMGPGANKGVLNKGLGTFENPIRVEGRMNNTDYAADPTLNLVCNLIGLKRGLEFSESHSKIDEDKPLDSDSLRTNGFTFGSGFTTFQQTVDEFHKDPVIAEELPYGLQEHLVPIIRHYPAISRGEMSLESLRNQAEEFVVFQR